RARPHLSTPPLHDALPIFTLGRSGVRVSPISLGAMMFGDALGPGLGSSVKDSQRIVDRYLELGGNFIDTANFYMRGQSEKILGEDRKSTRLNSSHQIISYA